MTRWLEPPAVEIPASFASLDLPLLLAQTLVRRGNTDADSARAFLHPDTLPSVPFPGIESATERVILATRTKEPICVWGDFDVDGQTATTLLVQTLQALGANVVYYIPVRGKESHGVHVESLKSIIDAGAKLILTCDTGITAYEAIDYAFSRGVEVVVTDHHDLGERPPNAKAIINPKLLAEDHPLANLAGVGVAYKLAEALLIENRKSEIESLLDLVALGLIADVALLKGETRALAQRGIQALRRTNRLGLKLIAELSDTNLAALTEETIGFTFAPRLNALGRLSDANSAVELLMTQDAVRARVLATQIEGLNTQRKLLTEQVHQAAEAQLHENPDLLAGPVILLSHPNWPGGVVGIVAARLAERYHKPAILLAESEGGILRGSARSVEGLHITQAISANKDLLLGFGGHPMAAGLSLEGAKLPEFRRALGKTIQTMLGEADLEEETLEIDAWLSLDGLSLELADQIERLAPFGPGNPALTFATRGLTLQSATEIGKAKEHRKLIVADERGTKQEVVWWNAAGEDLPEALTNAGGKFDLAYSLRANTFRGERRITLEFEDFRIVEERPVKLHQPRIEIRDYRRDVGRLENMGTRLLIWAEGPDESKGQDRFNLRTADEFVILTAPSSSAELRAALDIVKPKTIYLFAISPALEKTDEFLTRLAGMAKFAVSRRGGKVRVTELAAATAHREATIRLGLEWLAAGGHLSIEGEEDDLKLSAAEGIANQYLQRELYIAIKGLLEETAAYRDHFARADADLLFRF